eukprot:TRINITY_DN63_c1_g3_i1.p1 TRINITY_DN63_c1_g3~~TRINITY_DN63_c1_g3_i1.p1  ORF type:complete len:196 (-),score=56.86 TRINITY_DN63_c1_g3_i1:114-701(-)
MDTLLLLRARASALLLARAQRRVARRALAAASSSSPPPPPLPRNNKQQPRKQRARADAHADHDARQPLIRDSAHVQATAEAQRKQQAQLANARWVSSWMMPWERAQMDSPTRPLSLWERAYWRLFVALGSVGLIYETWVMGNRRLFTSDSSSSAHLTQTEMYADDMLRSTRLLSDDELHAPTPPPAPSLPSSECS